MLFPPILITCIKKLDSNSIDKGLYTPAQSTAAVTPKPTDPRAAAKRAREVQVVDVENEENSIQ